jgi:hypothetical protein
MAWKKMYHGNRRRRYRPSLPRMMATQMMMVVGCCLSHQHSRESGHGLMTISQNKQRLMLAYRRRGRRCPVLLETCKYAESAFVTNLRP